METLNNREFAVLIWLIAIFLFALSKQGGRDILRQFLSLLFDWRILTTLGLMVCYIVILIILLEQVGLWEDYLLKETVIWSTLVPLPLLMKFVSRRNQSFNLGAQLSDSMSIAVLTQFVISVYSFSLLVELILVPVATFIGGGIVVSEQGDDFQSVHKFLTRALALLGLLLLAFTIYRILTAPDGIANIEVVHEFFLTPFLTVLYWPFVYLFGLWCLYEELFKNARSYLGNNTKLLHTLKKGILFRCNFNLKRLTRARLVLARELTITSDEDDVKSVLQMI